MVEANLCWNPNHCIILTISPSHCPSLITSNSFAKCFQAVFAFAISLCFSAAHSYAFPSAHPHVDRLKRPKPLVELVVEWRRSGASTAQEPPPPPPAGLTLTWEISSTLSSKDAWLLNTLGGRGAQEEKEAV